MNNHREMQRRLAAYCGGDLEPTERQQLEQHLADCPACRAELADLQTTVRLLRSTPEVEPPPWLTGRIMAHLTEQQRAKSSWLQRLFFPLHIKLPLEVIALLTVCVSGYYLTRSVETGLQQTTVQQLQELPAQPAAGGDNEQLPAAAKKQSDAPGRAIPLRSPTRGETPAIVPPQQTVPAQPAYAPAPSVDRGQSGNKADLKKALPKAEPFNRGLEAAPERRAKSSRSLEQSSDAAAPAAADRAGGASAGITLPSVMVRLRVADASSAPALMREAVLRSGGTVMEESVSQKQSLRIRLPAGRQNELLERLERLGRITERPAALSGGTTEVEMIILW